MAVKYKRVLLKISGEALAGELKTGIDFDIVSRLAQKVKECVDLGVQVAIVVGGGNFWRGRSGGNMDRTRADHMGMLATALNALAFADGLEQLGVETRVQTAIEMRQIAEPYIRNKAVRHLEKGRVVVFGCGTGNPFFSTDTAAALRAAELHADAVFKGTTVAGVYDSDPRKNPDAKLLPDLTYQEALDRGLRVMDPAAFQLCMEQKIPQIRVFAMDDLENVLRVAKGEPIGTVVHP